MKIAIVGFGREGRAVYEYLFSKKEYSNCEFWILDKNKYLEVPLPDIARLRLGDNYLDNLDEFDLIFRSPGVSFREIASRLKLVNKLLSATKLFFQSCPCPIIGVTGTKGKGTVSTLIYNILKKCGRDAYLVGNIGRPALDVLSQLKPMSLVVFELSSFQLQDLGRSPDLAVILDVFPDHQDVHASYKEYLEAKANISRYQKSNSVVFYFSDNKDSFWIAKQGFGLKKSIYEYFNQKSREELRQCVNLPGRHNWRNVQAATVVTGYLGCDFKKILEAVGEFHGNEHRLESVSGGLAGVKIYNDSASTNPQTTIAAVRSFKEPKILIVGGSDKNLDYSVWEREFSERNIKAVVLIGENKEKMRPFIKSSIYDAENLRVAVRLARSLVKMGDVVLFSPGAASFDMFKDYADRGRQFKAEIAKPSTL